jgi:hypothetical protein
VKCVIIIASIGTDCLVPDWGFSSFRNQLRVARIARLGRAASRNSEDSSFMLCSAELCFKTGSNGLGAAKVSENVSCSVRKAHLAK